MKLPFEKGRAAVREALGLDKKPSQEKPFHQNPDGTVMELDPKGGLTDEQIQVIKEETEDLQ